MTRAEERLLEGHIRSVRHNAAQWDSWGWTQTAATAWAIVAKCEQRLAEAKKQR